MTIQELMTHVATYLSGFSDPYDGINELREALHDAAPNAAQPVDMVRWVPIEQVVANDYNPNSVARAEMVLLLRSIAHDGYTQPIVAIYNDERGLYEIVDGFHRYSVMKGNAEIRALCHGRVPLVVLKKNINERMASTVRHNRARGRHSVDGMSNMVFQMLENGMSDVDICNELGMEAEELLRLKHLTGFAKLFKDTEYNRAWVTKNQAGIARRRKEQEEADRKALELKQAAGPHANQPVS